MARNAYMGSPGSVQRLNDTHDEQIRIPRLTIAYGASAAPNVYTDGIGNGSNNCNYLTRHTVLSAMTATMAFGKRPWNCSNEQSDLMLKAANWHHKYLPTIHSAALDAFETGYPYTLTPLTIAYPDDAFVHKLYENNMWHWLIGESFLAHPAFAIEGGNSGDNNLQDVYLPEGRWINFNNGEVFDVDNNGFAIEQLQSRVG